MLNNLRSQIHQVAMTRSLIDIETSLLIGIRENLNLLLTEEIEGLDEISKQLVRSSWRAEIADINLELIKRN